MSSIRNSATRLRGRSRMSVESTLGGGRKAEGRNVEQRFDFSQELGVHAEVTIVARARTRGEPGGDFLLDKKDGTME